MFDIVVFEVSLMVDSHTHMHKEERIDLRVLEQHLWKWNLPQLLGGSWVLITTVISLLRTYLGDLGGLISRVLMRVIRTMNLQVAAQHRSPFLSRKVLHPVGEAASRGSDRAESAQADVES